MELRRIDTKETLKNFLSNLNMRNKVETFKDKFVLTKFQIENMKISSVYINNKKEILSNQEKTFSQIEKSILEENEFLDFDVEIEMIPFGEQQFRDTSEENEIVENKKKRQYNQKGNVVLSKGLNKNLN